MVNDLACYTLKEEPALFKHAAVSTLPTDYARQTGMM